MDSNSYLLKQFSPVCMFILLAFNYLSIPCDDFVSFMVAALFSFYPKHLYQVD